jgi:hypothetical protein
VVVVVVQLEGSLEAVDSLVWMGSRAVHQAGVCRTTSRKGATNDGWGPLVMEAH